MSGRMQQTKPADARHSTFDEFLLSRMSPAYDREPSPDEPPPVWLDEGEDPFGMNWEWANDLNFPEATEPSK